MQPERAPCCGSRADSRLVDFAKVEVGYTETVLVHPACACNTGCRRVALWTRRPRIELADDWALKIIARVRFSDNCQGPEVEVDWKQGVILDLLGCRTEVTLELVEKIVGETPLPAIRFGALSACCGAGGARGDATRTYATIEVANGQASPLIPVPPFAYALSFMSQDSASFYSADTTIAVSAGGGATFIDSITGDVLRDMGGTLPLGGGAVSVALINGGAAPITFEPVFLIGV